MATIGYIEHFNDGIEDFETYCAQMELFFAANELPYNKKVASFLTLASPKSYALTKSLVLPEDPTKCTHVKIKKELQGHQNLK